MTIWTLIVDDTDGIYTSVHADERDALATLFANYDTEKKFARYTDAGDFESVDDVQPLLDEYRLTVYIREHDAP